MRVVAIVQARMSSTRLPGKVLLELAGKPVIGHVVERLRVCKKIDNVIVATSIESSDDQLVLWCEKSGVASYRGSLNDVLDRYVKAASQFKASVIVRVTADCPAIDPNIVDEVIEGFFSGNYDYYGLRGEFPDGLDCTVFSARALEEAWSDAKLPSDREHVGPYIERNSHLFNGGGLNKFQGQSHMRWTLDEPRDYEFLKVIFNRLYKTNPIFLAEDILSLLENEPELKNINANIIRNEGYLKSLEKDKK